MSNEPDSYYRVPGDGQYPTASPPPPAKPKGHPIAGILAVVAALLAVLCVGGAAIAWVASGGDNKAAKAPALTAPTPGAKPVPGLPTKTARSTLTKSDVELTVKVTDKDCFGSAGCNVQWEVRAAVPGGKNTTKIATGDTCEVTYRMRGLTDASTGTLTINDDGTYNSDSFNIGQTRKSSTKVTAEVTEVECGR